VKYLFTGSEESFQNMKAVLADKKRRELRDEKLKEEREKGGDQATTNEAQRSRAPDPAKATEDHSPPRSRVNGKG
jgi:hypothetical protein